MRNSQSLDPTLELRACPHCHQSNFPHRMWCMHCDKPLRHPEPSSHAASPLLAVPVPVPPPAETKPQWTSHAQGEESSSQSSSSKGLRSMLRAGLQFFKSPHSAAQDQASPEHDLPQTPIALKPSEPLQGPSDWSQSAAEPSKSTDISYEPTTSLRLLDSIHTPSSPAADATKVDTGNTETAWIPARRHQRILAWAIDALVPMLCAILGAKTWPYISGSTQSLPNLRLQAPWDLLACARWIDTHPTATLVGMAAGIAAAWLICTLAGAYGFKSLGMRITGLQISSAFGEKLSLPQSALRAMWAMFSWLPFGAGYAYVLVDRWHRAWHDILTDTWVIEPQQRSWTHSLAHDAEKKRTKSHR